MNDRKQLQLSEVLKAQTEGGADEATMSRLAELLRDDPEAQAYYVEYSQMHAMLAWEHGVLPEVTFDDSSPSLLHSEKNASSEIRSMRRWRQLAIAATLLLVTSAGWHIRNRSQSPAIAIANVDTVDAPLAVPIEAWNRREILAVVTKRSGAQLTAPDVAMELSVGDQVRTGKYELTGGFVELTFDNGVEVIVESPASFEIASQMFMILQSGRLAAKVSPEGDGFTVETPTANIVDFGTEFAVEVLADKSSEVHVFDGEVDVSPKKALPKTSGVRLHTDRATRINKTGNMPEGIDIDHDRFLRELVQTDPRSDRYGRIVESLNPVTFLRMELTDDGRTLLDQGAINTPGTIVGGQMLSPPFAAGRLANALRLGGPETRAYAVVAEYVPAANNQISVFAWVRAKSRARWGAIAKNWAFELNYDVKDYNFNQAGQFHFGLYRDEGDLEVQVQNADGELISIREGVPIPLDQWQFVGFIVDGQAVRLYRNGKEVASTPCVGLNISCPKQLGIGTKLSPDGTRPDISNPGFWHGCIDELAIFHDALPIEKIRELYEAANHQGTVSKTPPAPAIPSASIAPND
ncbi:FecR protein [Planctomycetes bacterium CA13]|uniref:FecR protein n=1 Tax=Novipirellula herctigrandis TaxID=2527986 RepID=A0A5C5YWI3_9BACT|nr:FecR protein [Planctomycetes bacterium CA13]